MRITRFLHSRGAMIAAAVLMVLAAWSAYASGDDAILPGDRGIALPSPVSWLPDRFASLICGVASSLLTMGLMLFLNRRFNLLRDLSTLFCVLFAGMQAATPMLTSQFYSGSLLALTIGASLALMFGCYACPWRRRRVFLVFFLLSAGVAVQYAFAVYIPVMLLCCWQMRIMSGRTMVAVLLGLITPWWLLLGFGIVAPDQFHAPELSRMLSAFTFADGARLAVTLLLTSAVLIVAVVLDLFRTIAYNARARSYNGTIVLTGAVTIVAMAIDFKNVATYVPLLNMLAAMQGAQFFIIHRTERSWIGILALLAAYSALFAWSTLA